MLDFGYYNMDCMEGMKQFPDKYFELAIVDPPYGIGYEDGGQYYTGIKGKKWDKPPDDTYFKELFRVSKNQIIWGGNYFKLPPTRCVIAWTKTVEVQNRTFSEWEMAWTSFDTVARYINLKPFQRNGERIHSCQKPVALYTWLLNNYAKKGDKILDTHVGSASSLIACHKLGFKYVGFELDKDYYKASMERLQAVKDQISMFDGEVIK